MKRLLLALCLLSACVFQTNAQINTSIPNYTYRATSTKTHQLVHTKLDVQLDFENAQLYGKEWLTLYPYFYPAQQVTLDAKGMEIKTVALVQGNTTVPLKYTYDKEKLNIVLNKTYQAQEKYTLYFEYISKPEELDVKGSAAIMDAKGLYFINPGNKIPNKPVQVWTQGETESNSVWFITIDKPNQQTTQELSMTVPDSFVTLSNGLLVHQKKNSNGTRTDTWKLDIPHAPYLFFMGAGMFEIIKDKPFKSKEISYYVEKPYAPYAKEIFGNTAEMLQFFEDFTGVPYIWPKYAQIVCRDYVSGAMENSTAVIHQYNAYQNNRELADGNSWEETIAHEAFHHWFGNIVTTESWSNLTINESFANYSEYLWLEYKYGKDKADEHAMKDRESYINGKNGNKDLVRFYYDDKEDMFDAVSYNKGGRILHMLRHYVGDDAFKKALQLFLTRYKHQPVEAVQLRLAFEEVTGIDLNWFWNQWYFGSGHPKLQIDYKFDDAKQKALLTVRQTQRGNAFILPVKIAVYQNDKPLMYDVWLTQKTDSFSFDYTEGKKPSLILFDPERVLLAEIKDNKSEAYYIQQWKLGKSYENRKDAITYFAENSVPEIAKGLVDPYAGIRAYTIEQIEKTPYKDDKVVLKAIEELAQKELNKNVKATAIRFLANRKEAQYMKLFTTTLEDISYSVAGESLRGIYMLNNNSGVHQARSHGADAKGILASQVLKILTEAKQPEDFTFIANAYDQMPLGDEKISTTVTFIRYMEKLDNVNQIKTGIDYVIKMRDQIPAIYKSYVDEFLKMELKTLADKKGNTIRQYLEEKFK
jgi:aminopeptidase N